MKTFITLLLCLACFQLLSQTFKVDTLTWDIKKDSLFLKKKPWFDLVAGFDDRNLFLAKPSTKIDGIKVGIELYHRYRFGYSFFFLGKVRPLDVIFREKDTVQQQLKLTYMGPFFEYVAYEDFRWEVSFPFNLGLGQGKIDTNTLSKEIKGRRVTSNLLFTSAGINAHYRIFHWLGIGAGIGYSHVFTKEPAIKKVLNSPYYAIRVKLFLGGLYRSIFKPKVVKQLKLEYQENRKHKKFLRQKRKAMADWSF
ncbi:MAG: hypothetical protein K1X82_03005 [Bacteroidia bacterium]|nr:hypothetical protein [Bacteroidia bacterium]